MFERKKYLCFATNTFVFSDLSVTMLVRMPDARKCNSGCTCQGKKDATVKEFNPNLFLSAKRPSGHQWHPWDVELSNAMLFSPHLMHDQQQVWNF